MELAAILLLGIGSTVYIFKADVYWIWLRTLDRTAHPIAAVFIVIVFSAVVIIQTLHNWIWTTILKRMDAFTMAA